MLKTLELGIIRLFNLFLLPVVLIFLLVHGASASQKDLKHEDKARVQQRIATIIRETLQRAELNKDGYKVVTRSSPSEEAIKEVKQYGDLAIPALVEFFDSENPRERNLAVRLLGSLGGQRIIKPLREVILSHPSPDFRELALRWITQAPWDEASEVIGQAARNDPSRRVRKVAKELLVGYAPK